MNSKARILLAISLLVYMVTFAVRNAANGQTGDSLAPEGISGETYFAAYPHTAILDGELDDWVGVPHVSVTDGPNVSPRPASDGELTFAVTADSTNLYVLFQVRDDHIVAGRHGIDYFNEDSVELYLNTTGNLTQSTYVQGVAQIVFPAVNIGRPIELAVFNGRGWEDPATVGMQAITLSTSTGYAIEASIPLHNSLWNITPTNGSEIGFQVQLNSATELDRDVKLSWSKADKTQDVSYMNPSVFGRLIFHQIEGNNKPAPTFLPPTITATPAVESTPTAAAISTNFTVRDGRIYDLYDEQFVAKGTNVSGYQWVWQRKTVNDVDQIDNCWNFNLVRVNSFLFMGRIRYQQYTVNNDLDEIVRTFTSRKIVVVLEAHDYIGGYYVGNDLQTLVSWYTDLATRYRDNPYVWFDVMNEPGGRRGLDTDNWLNTHRQVINAIRNVAGSNNIIIVEGAWGGQDAGAPGSGPVREEDSAILKLGDQVITFDGKTYENIVFSIHPYDLWNGGDARMTDFFDRVAAKGFALIIGEYGVYTDQDTTPALYSLFRTTPQRGIGKIVWHWDGGDNNDLTTNTSQGGGWQINDCQKPTNLSTLGSLVWNDNHDIQRLH